jgi:thioredoxin-dependent peroxiredoxin
MSNESKPMPEAGKNAPAFTLPSQSGDKVSLSGLKGQPVVVYFYPRDDTPGCTIEAKEFQAQRAAFEKAGAAVVGISTDTVASHEKFACKYGLEFTLLADEDHSVAGKYGVWVEKNRYGKKSWGIQRATFLIDAEGRIAKVWPKVSPEGHAEEVLEAIAGL